jgi:DNA-directed RNA polymerase subunit beta'
VRGARDELVGLKENIIIGHLIPAGTGVYRYFDVEFLVEDRAAAEEEAAVAGEAEVVADLARTGEPAEEERPTPAD